MGSMKEEITEKLEKLSTGKLLEIADYIIRSERMKVYARFPFLSFRNREIIDQGSPYKKMGTLENISKILYKRHLSE